MTDARRTKFAKCSRCGRDFRARARFCPHCGVPVAVGKGPTTSIQKPVAEPEQVRPAPARPLQVKSDQVRTDRAKPEVKPDPLKPDLLGTPLGGPPPVKRVQPAVPAPPAAKRGSPATIPPGAGRPPLLLAPLVLLLALFVFLFAWLAGR